MNIDPFVIVALMVSIFSALFVAIKEGIGLTLEYRESEVTMKKKKEIDEKLRHQVKDDMKKLVASCVSKKDIDEETLKSAEDIGYEAYLSRSATVDLLDGIVFHAKRAFRNLGIALYFLFFTIVFGVYFWDIYFLNSLLSIGVLGSASFIYFVYTIRSLKNYYSIREKFGLLYENPTIERCREVINELMERDLL